LEKGMNNLILYTGKGSFTSRVAACLKGLIDAGVNIPVSEASLPKIERINGGHIAQYAEVLKKDEGKYNSHFSSLLINGWVPENYSYYFEEVRTKITKNMTTVPDSTLSERSNSPTRNAPVI
jgi:large subunit ribosomal protein L18